MTFTLKCNLIVLGAGGISPSEIIKNVSSLSGNLLKDLRYYVNKNLSVKSLSSTGLSLFSLLSARSKLFSLSGFLP